jgi:hypothetical protein
LFAFDHNLHALPTFSFQSYDAIYYKVEMDLPRRNGVIPIISFFLYLAESPQAQVVCCYDKASQWARLL